MVRLCVPAGDEQHALTRRPRLGFSAAEPSLIESPSRACLLAAVSTAFRSVLGFARPGTFVRTAAIFGLIDGSITACDIYGRQELNRAVFKLDGLDSPKPWKLWERTSQWTLEDATLFGGATGLLLASNPRLVLGASGWTRFLGITITGCAIGAKTGEWVFGRGPPHQAKRVEWVLAAQRRAMYRRLSEDEKAKASLSRFGRSLLMAYTGDSPIMQTLSRPFRGLSSMPNPGSDAVSGRAHQDAQMEAARQIQIQQAHAKQPILMLTEFEKEELAAPDYDGGHRQYFMDPADTDIEILQEHLEHLNKLRASDVKELAYIWQGLAQKEHHFHQLSQDNPEKDLLRRELQLLNSLATHFNTRIAILAYAQADARKRIDQIRNEDPASASMVPLPVTEEALLGGNWRESHSPQKSAERIRQRWETARTDLAQVEHVLSQFDTLKAQGSTNSRANEQAELLRKDAGQMKQNIMATERLLKEYEDQIYKVDASAGS
ncbi:uncharacterized protein EKO05_0001989 [Ascochyta rabiei]|uniref:uncharacterized protein n=1 Tax=Didymella rabiei TaxID=5454 RepID=UPI0018FFD5E6|nr:uncharacterized protein EKO05_0001989 [Ascochyta rabiei]UPX11383.1 hypothetical protein EKO05_0001989 [Ascochyta rabiei]